MEPPAVGQPGKAIIPNRRRPCIHACIPLNRHVLQCCLPRRCKAGEESHQGLQHNSYLQRCLQTPKYLVYPTLPKSRDENGRSTPHQGFTCASGQTACLLYAACELASDLHTHVCMCSFPPSYRLLKVFIDLHATTNLHLHLAGSS